MPVFSYKVNRVPVRLWVDLTYNMNILSFAVGPWWLTWPEHPGRLAEERGDLLGQVHPCGTPGLHCLCYRLVRPWGKSPKYKEERFTKENLLEHFTESYIYSRHVNSTCTSSIKHFKISLVLKQNIVEIVEPVFWIRLCFESLKKSGIYLEG